MKYTVCVPSPSVVSLREYHSPNHTSWLPTWANANTPRLSWLPGAPLYGKFSTFTEPTPP
jgi:hypothetical protein